MDEFDALITEIIAKGQIPDLAVAVVREKPPLLRCWGLRDIETSAPVGPDTLFPICSVTKSFVATALALLVDDGKLQWDTPARETLSEFRSRDPITSEQAMLRELLTASRTCRHLLGGARRSIGLSTARSQCEE